jgi:hypothetical protein
VWSAQLIPTAVDLGFLNRSRYFSFKKLLSCPDEVEWTPFQTRRFSENLEAPIQHLIWDFRQFICCLHFELTSCFTFLSFN